ncbi:MAG TPA: outer membrane lipoprotein chaperone LolA, partial [Gammaproteobacteria bacterium]|nr:outer membrane lipoprotein chaperone LolA [Gammaproteobacteria bacterium]
WVGIAFSAQSYPSQDLMKRLEEIQSYQAQFKQVIKDDKGKQISTTEGDLQVARPGRFRWKSQTPDQVLVVADGKFIWTYDIELEQVVKNNQNTSLGQSPAALLAGEVVNLEKDYAVELAQPADCHRSVDACYKLVAKDQNNAFKNIKMGFSGKNLITIEMQDALDQNILTEFKQVQVNQTMNNTIFQFKPPAGVDVIQGSN